MIWGTLHALVTHLLSIFSRNASSILLFMCPTWHRSSLWLILQSWCYSQIFCSLAWLKANVALKWSLFFVIFIAPCLCSNSILLVHRLLSPTRSSKRQLWTSYPHQHSKTSLIMLFSAAVIIDRVSTSTDLLLSTLLENHHLSCISWLTAKLDPS